MSTPEPTKAAPTVQELESRQDEVLRQLDDLMARLDAVLDDYAAHVSGQAALREPVAPPRRAAA